MDLSDLAPFYDYVLLSGKPTIEVREVRERLFVKPFAGGFVLWLSAPSRPAKRSEDEARSERFEHLLLLLLRTLYAALFRVVVDARCCTARFAMAPAMKKSKVGDTAAAGETAAVAAAEGDTAQEPQWCSCGPPPSPSPPPEKCATDC